MSTRLVTAAGVAVAVTANALPSVTALATVRTRFFPALAGRGDTGGVALTFDDGPDPRSTPRFLAALADRGVHATFFVLGSMLVRSPGVGRDLVDAGHELAVHGWTHRNLLFQLPTATYDELARTRDLVAEATGRQPRFYRPPHGILTASALAAARRLELRPVLWTCWGRDWRQRSTPRSVLATIRADLAPGGTILLHDSDCTSAPGSWRSTLEALPALFDECAERGLRVGPLRTHLGAREGACCPVAPPWGGASLN